MNYQELVGKSYSFEDGNTIEVIQIKHREVNGETTPCVTYQIYQGSNLPRKLILTLNEFLGSFGHLFGYDNQYTIKPSNN
jgi:hypothetical protein